MRIRTSTLAINEKKEEIRKYLKEHTDFDDYEDEHQRELIRFLVGNALVRDTVDGVRIVL
jgi:hypothetical protein